MNQIILSLYSHFPQLHQLDALSTDPMRVLIIELSLFTIILCLFHNRRAAFIESRIDLSSASEHSEAGNRRTEALSSQLSALDLRLKTLERQLEVMNHDMTSLVEHLMIRPGEPLRVKAAKAPIGTGLHSSRR